MAARSWVFIPLGETEVNYVNHMLLLLNADQKVVWFYISVQETILVDKLNSLQHLYGEHQNRF